MNPFKMFMLGRYGTDQLSIALIIIGMILSFIADAFSSSILTLASYIAFGLCVFRITSKNISLRQKENNQFLKLWNPTQAQLLTYINMIKDHRSNKYFKCPNCKQLMRVPKGKGKILVTCKKCKTKFIKET